MELFNNILKVLLIVLLAIYRNDGSLNSVLGLVCWNSHNTSLSICVSDSENYILLPLENMKDKTFYIYCGRT